MDDIAITIGEWYLGAALSKNDKSKAIRKAFDFPLTKTLVYYANSTDASSKCEVKRYRILQTFNISNFWAIIEIETIEGRTVKIHSAYLKDMQNPKFINNMRNQNIK